MKTVEYRDGIRPTSSINTTLAQTVLDTASQLVSFANQELPATALAEIDKTTPLLEFGILDSLAMVSLSAIPAGYLCGTDVVR